MSILTKVRALFSGDGLVCPHCEKPLEGHDQAACERGMSRRYFFGSLLGGIVAAATAPTLVESVVLRPYPNIILTPEVYSRLALQLFDIKFGWTQNIERGFGNPGRKIGDTVRIRKPSRYAQ